MMLKILHSPRIKSFQADIPKKAVTIIGKNGRDIIRDEFVGFYVKRPGIIELITNLFFNIKR